jgi:hypothetical protein
MVIDRQELSSTKTKAAERGRPFGERFGRPANQELEITEHSLGPRAYYFLRDHSLTRLEDLLGLSEDQLLGYRRCSRKIIREIVSVMRSLLVPDNATQDNIAAIRRPRRGRITEQAPSTVRRCFLHDGRWWFRIDIDAEALRGSGLKVPVGIMTLFQVARGTERRFQALGKEIKLSWMGKQPALGSVRHLINELNGQSGDTLWVTPAQDQIAVRLLHRAPESDTKNKVRLLCGIDDDGAPLLAQVTSALGLSGHRNLSNIIQALRSRGDADVADLLEPHESREPRPAPDMDEFLDALRAE